MSEFVYTSCMPPALAIVPLHGEICHLIFSFYLLHRMPLSTCYKETRLGQKVHYVQIRLRVGIQPASPPIVPWWISLVLQLYRGLPHCFYCDTCICLCICLLFLGCLLRFLHRIIFYLWCVAAKYLRSEPDFTPQVKLCELTGSFYSTMLFQARSAVRRVLLPVNLCIVHTASAARPFA